MGPESNTTTDLIAAVISLIVKIVLLSPLLWVAYVCIQPIFEWYGTLIGIVSFFPFGPITTGVMLIWHAHSGWWTPLLVSLGTAFVAGPLLEGLSELIVGEVVYGSET